MTLNKEYLSLSIFAPLGQNVLFHFLAKLRFYPLPPQPHPSVTIQWFHLALHVSLTEGIGGQSSLKQQDGRWEQEQEAAEAGLRRGPAPDSVVVWRVGEQSRPVPGTMASHAHPAARAADVIAWGRSERWNTVSDVTLF